MKQENARLVWWIGGLVLAACLAMSRNLMTIWQIDPFVKSGGFAFAIWSASVIWTVTKAWISPGWQWVMGAAVLHLAASATGFEIIRHASLATAVAAFVPTPRGRVMVLLASVGWMPALGWFGHRFFAANLDPVRIPITLAFVWLSQLRGTLSFQWPPSVPKVSFPIP